MKKYMTVTAMMVKIMMMKMMLCRMMRPSVAFANFYSFQQEI